MNELQHERERTRAEVAAFFRQLADGFQQHGKVTFVSAQERSTIEPPDRLHVRMQTKADCTWIQSEDGRSIVLEVGWEAESDEPEKPSTAVAQPNAGQRVSWEDHT